MAVEHHQREPNGKARHCYGEYEVVGEPQARLQNIEKERDAALEEK